MNKGTSISRLAALFAVFCLGAVCHSAEIGIGISARETYVGLPVTMQIRIANATSHEPPQLPEVDGLEIQSAGVPQTSTRTTIINGRSSTSRSVTYQYLLTPVREGTFTVPPFTIEADGRIEETGEFEITATKSETGDLLFVEISGKQDQIYVGQALELTLRIWIRPFRDQERRVTLSAADMWRMISDQTQWGEFESRIAEMIDGNELEAREVLREDSEGVKRSYYLYEIDTTIYPQRPGQIEGDEVRIVVQYPTALGRSRDPFGGFFDDDVFSFSPFGSRRLAVTATRPITADSVVEPIDVLPIPVSGRPPDYRGAVGRYRIVTEAKPTSVKAGDPITLLIGIAGTGPMELVQAPPLTELAALTAGFRVPNELLAGYAQGDQKVFSTTIRPRSEDVTEIPPIPFSFFDPESEEFVTVESEPIPVQVEPADTLALDAIVGGDASKPLGSDATRDGKTEGPYLDNYQGEDLLRSESPAVTTANVLVGAFALPPLLVGAIWLVRSRQQVLALAGHLQSHSRQCERAIHGAEHSPEIVAALTTFLGQRFALPIAELNAESAVGALRTAGYQKQAIDLERLIDRCGKPHLAIDEDECARLDELRSSALELFHTLQTCRSREQSTAVRARKQPAKAGQHRKRFKPAIPAVLLISCGFAVVTGSVSTAQSSSSGTTPGDPRQPPAFSEEVQVTLLQEATRQYQQAVEAPAGDPAEAKQSFAAAAEKYQLIVDAGVTNGRLYFNLANAYLQSAQFGRAIANYRRALRVDPTNQQAAWNLDYVQQKLASAAAGAVTAEVEQPWWTLSRELILAVNRFVHPQTMTSLLALAWLSFWLVVVLRIFDLQFPWKTCLAVAMAAMVVTGASCWLRHDADARQRAVIVSQSVTLREGDGTNFLESSEVRQAEGRLVDVLGRRGDWVHVRTELGQSGWVLATDVELI